MQRTTAPAPGGDEELAATIGEIFEVALDRDRPAWQLWYVEGLADGRVALVLKIHHAVADGTASLRLLETLYSADPQTPLPQPRSTPLPNERRPAPWLWWPRVHAPPDRGTGTFPEHHRPHRGGHRGDPPPSEGRKARLRRSFRRTGHALQRTVLGQPADSPTGAAT